MRTPSPKVARLLRIVAGLAVVGGIVWTVGAGPFLHGLTSVSWFAIMVASVLAAVASASAVWRWRIVASALDLDLSWWGAVAAYYRSQFLNTVLPGGVVGDVHRAYRHGRRSGSVALAARAVATERIAGQVVQLTLVAVALSVIGMSSPLHALAWVVGGLVALLATVIGLVATTTRGRRVLRSELRRLGQIFGDPFRSAKVIASSILVVASHVTVFVVATIASGVHAPLSELIALALIVLTAAALPLNLGGWGPREGAAAAAFAAVGLGAGAGVAASTAFAIAATIAVVPGAAVLVVSRVLVARERRLSRRSVGAASAAEETPEYEPLPQEVHA
jgi:uncharacterized membrane protein YbhN (UPF0104 family)